MIACPDKIGLRPRPYDDFLGRPTVAKPSLGARSLSLALTLSSLAPSDDSALPPRLLLTELAS